MAQEVPVFDDQHDVAGYLRGEGEKTTHKDIANYLQAHSYAFEKYFDSFAEYRVSIPAFVQALKGNNDEKIDACREIINKCLDRNVDGLPIGEPEQEPQPQPHARPSNTSILERIYSVGRALRSKLTIRKVGGALALSIAGLGVGDYLSNNSQETNKTPVLHSFAQATYNLATSVVHVSEESIPVLQQSYQDISDSLSLRFREVNEAYQLSQNAILDNYPNSYYNPFLVRQLETDTDARQYILWITQAALEHDLDPVRFANQMHRESRQFDPQIVSGRERSSAGALGLAQFMPSTAINDYGLTEDDLRNPHTSIFAAARMMADLTQEYNGDQALAEIAYNGGRGAVDFVREEMTLEPILASIGLERHELSDERRDEILQGQELVQISSRDWMAFMQQRRIDRPSSSSGAWQNQTYDYGRYIDGSGWELAHRQWSRQQQADGLPNHMLYIGVSVANHFHQFNGLQTIAVTSLLESDTSFSNTSETRAPDRSLRPIERPRPQHS